MVRETSRDCRFDNLKGLLIFFVVLGHAMDLLGGTTPLISKRVLAVILSFHIPAFVFVSGYFSKHAAKSEGQFRKLVSTILIPFLIAHILKWLTGSRTVASFFYPTWTLWYLLSLFFWRLLVVPFSKLRFSVAIAFLLAIGVGFAPADQLFSLSRTAALFPLFLLGYKTGAAQMDRLRRINRLIPAAVFVLLAAVVVVASGHFPLISISSMEGPYQQIEGITEVQGMLLRTSALLIGAVLTACLFCLVPQKQTFLSGLGRNTMTVYLGHSFFLSAVSKLLALAHLSIPAGSGIPVILVSLALSAISCVLFANPWVVALYNKAVDWLGRALMVKDSDPGNAPQGGEQKPGS